jgi:integrase/recombinase XerC
VRPANHGKTYPAETLTADEARAIVRAAGGDSALAARNQALVATIYRGALRAAEACSLYPQDVDTQAATVRVRNGKGGRSRLVALDDDALALLRRWIERRQALGFTGRAALFCSLQGKALDPSYLRKLLPALADAAGIERRVHPHILRHTRASELASAGIPPHVIQRVLGHTSLATTDRYLAHVAPQEVIDAMRAGNWLEAIPCRVRSPSTDAG